MTTKLPRAALALLACAQLTPAAAQIAYSDALVQAPQLAAPERGSLSGQYASLGFGPADLVRGAVSLRSPFAVASERGGPGVDVLPSYSPEAGLSEWGLGWQGATLALQRWRVAGDLDYATDDLSSPWGRLVRGNDGAWYPVGLRERVRVDADAADVLTATLPDGSRWVFDLKVNAPAGAARTGTYAWYLTSVATPTGRRTELSYVVNASGRPFLARVSYGGVGTAFQHQIDFEYEAIPLSVSEYRAGFALTLDRRVGAVSMKSLVGTAMAERWRYGLTYRSEGLGPAFLLAAAQRIFASGDAEPATTYDYATSAERLATLAFRAIPKADGLVAQFGPAIFQANRSTPLDGDLDARADLEHAYDQTLFLQQDGGFVAQPLPQPPPPDALPVCRPNPSLGNPPRALAQMRAGEEAYSVVALVTGAGITTLNLCNRAGQPTHAQTLPYAWTLGPKVRLADLNRDFQPDLIRFVGGRYEVLPNTSTAAGYAFGTSIAGALAPAISPSAIWLHDMNGDGIPDLVARMPTALVVWPGKGSFGFGPQGTVLQLYSRSGALVAPSLFELTFVDANKDGLTDLVATRGSVVYLFMNTGTRFRETAVPAFTFADASTSRAVVADLAGSGDTELAVVKSGHTYSMALAGPDTNLLRTADDGKGTVLRFLYERADAVPGIRSRPSVLRRLTVESSGSDPVSYDFAYATPQLHTVGRFLLGFDRITRTDLRITERMTFINDDRYAGILASSLRHDVNAPAADAFESKDYEDPPPFQGIPWKRLKQERSGFQDAGGASVETKVDYASYVEHFCPQTVVRTTAPGVVLTTTKGYVRPAGFGNALSCVWTSAVEQGSHPGATWLDFRHESALTRNAVGLVEKVESVAGDDRLVLQSATYRPDDWLVETVSSPGKGTTRFAYEAATLLLARVTTPDGVVVEALSRDPLHDGILTLRTTRGTASYEQFFRFDGQERLGSSWDNLRASTELNPVVRYAYQFATALEPAAIWSSTLVDAAAASARDSVDLLDAAGQPVTTAVRVPQGWAFGVLTTRSRATAETKRWLRAPLGAAADPTSLDHATLLSGASQVGSEVASAFGHDAAARTTYHADVERQVTRTLALSGGLLKLTALENGTHATSAWMDAGKRLLAWDDEAGTRHGYTYDALGRVREVAIPGGRKHRAWYDAHGRVWRVERDGVARVDCAFDALSGLPTTKRFFTHAQYEPANALARTVAYAYDTIGRVKAETHSLAAGGPAKVFTFHYDGATPSAPSARSTAGLLTGVSGDGYTKTFEYRPDGKVTRRVLSLGAWRTVETTFEYLEGGVLGGRTVRLYDALGAPLSASARSYGYDANGRLGTVKLNGALLATLGYDANGQLSSATFANGDTLTLSYDPLTRRPTGSAQASGGLSVATSVRLDPRGLVGLETIGVGATTLSRTYRHSPQRFLTGASDAQNAYGYGFDGSGLPTSVTRNGSTRIIAETGNTLTAGSTTYAFDGLHRTVSRSDTAAPSRTLTLAYGADGQLATAVQGGRTYAFVHDEAGQRLLKSAGSTPVAAFLDEGYLDGTGLTERFQVGGRTVGLVKAGVFISLPTDMRGTVIAEQTGAARVASPFGERDVHPGAAAAIDYVEKGFDADLGFVRMGVRDYDPAINRFTTPDPLFLEHPERCVGSPAECNLYGYARNAPTSLRDPSGEEAVEFDAPGGHHWVPEKVTSELLMKKVITPEAAKYLESQTTGWGKGIDPHQWSGAHKEYSQAVREMAAKFLKGEGNGIEAAKQLVEKVKASRQAAIRGFLDPHLKVVEMVKSGASREAIQEFWGPIRSSFTRRGGFVGFARSLGGRVLSVFNVLGMVTEELERREHEKAGDKFVPSPGYEAAWPAIGQWVPGESPEAKSFNPDFCTLGCPRVGSL